jgi:hypothetical protein
MIRENDIILLENWMSVFTDIPLKFLSADYKFSDETVHQLVRIGFPYFVDSSIKQTHESVSEDIRAIYLKIPGVYLKPDILKRFVEYTLPQPKFEPFILPTGEYMVMLITDADKGVRHIYAQHYNDDPNAMPIKVSFLQGTKDPGNLEDITVLRNLFD